MSQRLRMLEFMTDAIPPQRLYSYAIRTILLLTGLYDIKDILPSWDFIGQYRNSF